MPTLTILNGVYAWKGGYEDRLLPKEAGFGWNADLKRWETKLVEKAHKLLNYADPAAKAAIETTMAKTREALAASRATDADVVIPAPEGLKYLGYQKAGVAFAQNLFSQKEAAHYVRGVLIADEMGL